MDSREQLPAPAGASASATTPPSGQQAASAQPTFAQEAANVGASIHQFESHLPTLNQALSEIASFVPGFAGYKSTEDRRIADKQLRAVIGERLTKAKDRLDGVVDALSRGGDLDGLALIDQSGRRMGRLIDRMRFADYGYAAVFDRVQIGDNELASIYQFDAAILSQLGAFDAAIDDVAAAGNDGAKLRGALAKLDALTADFDKRFEGRKHLFDGLPTA
jgi:hypothetical protein